MRTTIKDIAREAGMSVASVSRAINGSDSVTPETRQRILDIATALNYSPHGAARSLITRRNDAIGVVLPELHGEFFSELIRGIDVTARAQRLHLLVSSSHGSAEETAAALRAMLGRVDGLVVMSPHLGTDLLTRALSAQLPTVLINVPVDDPAYGSLRIDNHAGAHAMTRHLLARGHRRVALLAGPIDNYDAMERERGYRDALAQFAPDAVAQVLPGDFSEESGHAAGQALLAMTARPDAVFAANDMMAVGCLGALVAGGLSVPDDIALAGFDDIPIARYVSPPLTTVRVNIADLGARAAAALIQTLKHDARVEHAVLAPELVVRASCAARPPP